MRTRSAFLLLVGVLLVSSVLESTELADAIPHFILDYDYSQNIKKFFGKVDFVVDLVSFHVIEYVEANNSTYLAFYAVVSAFIFIRIENEKIKFYKISRIISISFAIILVSSTVITPFSYSVLYWGDAFGEDDPLIVEEIINGTQGNSSSITFQEEQLPTKIQNNFTSTFNENLILIGNVTNVVEHHIDTNELLNKQSVSLEETFDLHDNATVSFYNNTKLSSLDINHTISLNETLNLTDNMQSPDLPLNYSQILLENILFFDEIILKLNGTTSSVLFDGLIISDDIALFLNNQTVVIVTQEPQEWSDKLLTNGLISDLIYTNLINVTQLPNATESWQFENNTENVELLGDAEIDYSEGINGTSLLLDGDQDFAQTNSTNSTTYITDMSIAAWVKPNYTNGSPEFTVVSKGKSFVLSINNIIDPQHIAKFSIFDGIKWTTVKSATTIPDDSWTHLTARFNKTSIELYVNGTLQGSVTHEGVLYITEKGQIELKTLQEITSYQDIVIGAALTTKMDSRPFNMFSGMIDGVQLFDSKLEQEDVMQLYLDTVPVKAPKPEPILLDKPEPTLRYVLNITELELPVSISADDLNNDLNQLTVSTWINPNYSGGSPEFTILSKENSFVLALNKMLTPEKVAKFSVYDGMSWYTVTGSIPINDWSHVAATINGTNVSLYVNGKLDSMLDSGPPVVVGSTSDVVIGAYENKLRTEAKLSNFFSGVIQQAEVYKYGFVDLDILDSFQYYLEEYQPENDLPGGKDLAIALNETLGVFDSKGIPGDDGLLVEISTTANNSVVEIDDESMLAIFTDVRKISNYTNIDDIIKELPPDSEIANLFEKVEEKGLVRVIVGLNTEFQPEGLLSSRYVIQQQLEDIENIQNSLLEYMVSYNMSSHHIFKHIPYTAITVDKNSLFRILSSPLIKSIQEDKPESPSLYYSVPLVSGDSAHQSGFTGAGQTIAILDTGVESAHSFLAGKVVSGACYSSNTVRPTFTVCPNGLEVDLGIGAGEPCDSSISGCDHGTHVAGIAAGWSDGTFPVGPGVAKDANIIAIQVFSEFTNPADCGGAPPCARAFQSDQIAGLQRVYDLRFTFDISTVNMSLGGGKFTMPCDGDPRKAIIDLLRAAGIATIISSGNDSEFDGIQAPACISSAISVGSTTVDSWGFGYADDTVSTFSNSASFLDLLAPGQVISSSVPGDAFAFFQGTSMAAPHVAGAWALLKQKNSTMTVDYGLSRLKDTGVPILDARNGFTFPRIQVFNALNPFVVNPDLTSVDDTITTVSSLSRTIQDSASVDDTITAVTFIPVTTEDSTSVDDTISATSSLSRTLTDSASVDDTISTTSSLSRTIQDSASTDDSISTMFTFSRTLSDSVSVDDTITAVTFIPVTTEDSTSLGDTISVVSSFSRTLSDSASTGDSISTTSTFSRTLIDSVSTGDSISAVSFIPATTEDSASLSDSIFITFTSVPPPPIPTPPPEIVKLVSNRGTGATGFGSPAAGAGSSGGGGGGSDPESEDSVDQSTNNIQRTPPAELEKEITESKPTTESDEISKEEQSDVSDFLQQLKNIHMAMIIASISVVVAIFLVRARGILFG